jgi:hypothetical protein
LASLPFEGQFVISRRGGLEGFCPVFYSAIAEVDSRTICTILKLLIGSVPIGEGPRDVAE